MKAHEPSDSAVTLDAGSSKVNHTGSWRTERPVYVDRLPPCNTACPAGEDIQSWLYRAEEGDYRGAWERLVVHNPFPAIMGRVCYHPCEGACNRAQLDEAVGIHSVERFLGDLAVSECWPLPAPTVADAGGKRVLVVGAGPSGLAAAYHLRRLGQAVEIREAAPAAGGMMRYGIPKYRLPREVLDAEIARIIALGVTLRLSEKVDDIPKTMAQDGFDACFVAVGAQIGRRIEMPAPDAARIIDAVTLLARAASGNGPIQLGRRVAVVGGGNTAIDAARVARRLGADDAVILYRRSWAEMPAHAEEVVEALDEGVTVRWLREVRRFTGPDRILVEKMVLDAERRPRPTGEFEELPVDTLILALGQSVDPTLFARVPGAQCESDGTVDVDGALMTGHPGIFAGGDLIPGERSVTVAVGHGKRAARHIDAYLRGTQVAGGTKHPPATFERINPWYYGDAPKTVAPMLARARRTAGFDEVHVGLDEASAAFEARRCLSCGNCFECDNCYGVCPDNAVIKLGPGKRYEFDLDFCKGCGLCAKECPCGAIQMVPEDV